MNDIVEREITVEVGAIANITRGEIDMQIATAHKYPRSIKRFRDEALAMVTLTEEIAQECIYALPRDQKVIEGPSARFAEIVASAWGNCRAGARVVQESGDFIVSQGVFHDLERNVAIQYEVQRRIVDKNGRRFKPDMIGVTANAACSIALRNAILKGVPKAFWSSMYDAARKTVMGDVKTLANRRADAVKAFQAFGVNAEQLCEKLGVSGVEDIGLDHLVTLRGLLTAIREGDTTPEQAFAAERKPGAEQASMTDQLKAKLRKPAVETGEITEPPKVEKKAEVPTIETVRSFIDHGELETAEDLARSLPEDQKTEALLAVSVAKGGRVNGQGSK